MRAGTPNLLGAVAFGVAAEAAGAHLERRVARASRRWRSGCSNSSSRRFRISASMAPPSHKIANTLNLTFPGVLGESMLIALDLEGVEVSMGSACAAGAVEPSHVLLAMGLSRDEARSSLRLSLGWSTTAEEIERAAEIIARVWRRVRAAEPLKAAVSARTAAASGGHAMSARVLVAMSGGVDSSVAAAILCERGYDVVGVAMRLAPEDPTPATARRRGTCCSHEDFEDARRVAERDGLSLLCGRFARGVWRPRDRQFRLGVSRRPHA